MPFEQALLFGATALALATTLVVWVIQYRRMYGKRKDDENRDDD